MGDFREANGAISEDSLSSSSSSRWSGPDRDCFGAEKWARAERVTEDIILQVHPTVESEERRREVLDYVQRLIRNTIGCEVFSFGSVPLKTYLPDGDIDLTAFCDFDFEEGLAHNVYSVLEVEDRNPAAEGVVKDVQYIQAEVKLVKCLVQNIVVDISFNQIGGLCTLCFLEQVDFRIGKDHLFKRSIILIKAWCYYESRILGAHHSLISTYALETLVLYIFHRFHTSLNGPFEVLYKFLDYYSKFDWDNFCVNLNGPVHISTLPELVVERSESGTGDMLFSSEFFKECVEIFSVPPKGSEASKIFVQKHLNIVDPLRVNNNLGRSVSKGNFFRIRSAISLGARKLGRILSQPKENIAEEVKKFFANTLDRHGRGQRHAVDDPISGASCRNNLSCDVQNEIFYNDLLPIISTSTPQDCRTNSRKTSQFSNGKLEAKSPSSLRSEDPLVSGGSIQSDGENVGSKWEVEHHETLADLAGDYVAHLNNWQFGRWWFNNASGAPVKGSIPSPALFPRKNSWETIHHSAYSGRNMFFDVRNNGSIPRPPFFQMNPPIVIPNGAAFGMELTKAQGTGMYFPITNHQFYRDRSTAGKPAKPNRYNGRGSESLDQTPFAIRNREHPEIQSSDHQDNGKPRSSVCQDAGVPGDSEGGQAGPAAIVNGDRFAEESYHLKDEEDFPPLSM